MTNNQNLFLEKCIPSNSSFGYYLLGSLIIIIFNFIGQLPIVYFISENTNLNSSESVSDLLNKLNSNLFYFLILFPFLVSSIGFLLVTKILHNQSITKVTTSRTKIDINRICFSFFLWSFISISIFFLDYYLYPEDFEFNFKFGPFFLMFLISIIFIPFQSGLEEYIFRGYLMQGFAKFLKNRWLPLIFTSFIFGFLHYFNPEVEKLGPAIMIYYVGTGFFFGIITLMDEGIELSLGLHIANNLITALLVTADWTAFKTESIFRDISDPSIGSELITYLLIVYPITIIFFSKKYGWGNWKIKLFAKIE